VCYGAGLDSTAMIFGLGRLGIVPDLILFADTGGELPETYAYLDVMGGWLKDHGFPPIVVVRNASPRAGHKSLYDECMRNGALPSIAYRRNHSCALKWKVSPQQKYCNHFGPFRAAWKRGEKVVTAIGYDSGDGDGRRLCKAFAIQERKPSAKYSYWYPLVEWGWDRAACEQVCREESMPIPPKSSCFFCGARKKTEIEDLIVRHPDLFRAAIAMEDNAQAKLRKVKGLGTRFSWREFYEAGMRAKDDIPLATHALA
jgi:hypothetical protein